VAQLLYARDFTVFILSLISVIAIAALFIEYLHAADFLVHCMHELLESVEVIFEFLDNLFA